MRYTRYFLKTENSERLHALPVTFFTDFCLSYPRNFQCLFVSIYHVIVEGELFYSDTDIAAPGRGRGGEERSGLRGAPRAEGISARAAFRGRVGRREGRGPSQEEIRETLGDVRAHRVGGEQKLFLHLVVIFLVGLDFEFSRLPTIPTIPTLINVFLKYSKKQVATSMVLWPEEALFLVECNHLRLLLREVPGWITSAIFFS